jgi:hypothetical protein
MRHAIESAKLLAGLIASGKTEKYDRAHRRRFRRYRLASAAAGFFHSSSAAPFFFRHFSRPAIFSTGYRWLHA